MKERLTTFALVATVFFIGLASGLFLLPFWIQPFAAAVEKGNPSDWIGFAGNFGAGIMTLIAAIVAWFAVQRQISSARDIEEARRAREASIDQDRKDEAKHIAFIALTQPVVTAGMLRKAVDSALSATTPSDVGKWDGVVDQAIGWVEEGLSQHSLREILSELGRADRIPVLMFLTQLGTVVSIYKTQIRIHDRKERLARLQGHLEKLPKRLDRIDKRLLSLFEK